MKPKQPLPVDPSLVWCAICNTVHGHGAYDHPFTKKERVCIGCDGTGGRYIPHPHSEGRYVDLWQPCYDCAHKGKS